MKSAEYWKKRSEQIAKLQYDKADAYEIAQRREYTKSKAAIKRDIETFYARYAIENGVDMAEARKILTKGELKEFKMTLEEFTAKAKDNANGRWTQELNNAYYKTRITRLEALEMQINHRIEMLSDKRQTETGKLLGDIYKDTYHRNIYELQRGMGIGVSFAQVDDEGLKTILGAKLDGRNWSQRIWDDRSKLRQQIQTKLSQAFIRGDTIDRAVRDISERFDVSRSNAERLIQTESAFFVGQATKAGYLASGVVQKYEILATLDSRTTEVCRSLDGHLFLVSEANVGVNYPPLHVRCRTTTVAAFEDDEDPGERIARKPEGNSYYVPGNMSYMDWKKQYVDSPDDDIIKPESIIKTFEAIIDKAPGIKPEYKEALTERFNSGSTTAQRVFLDYVKDNAVADSRYKAGAHYSPVDRVIRLDFDEDLNNPRGRAAIFFHEMGHYVDNLAAIQKTGKATYDGVSHINIGVIEARDFKKAILRDVQNYMQNYSKEKGLDLRSAQFEISLALAEGNGALQSAVSDIYGGVTKRRIQGRYGHSPKYWQQLPNAIEKEAFAHMFEASFDPTGKRAELMQKYLPKSFALFHKILEEI
ncbi:minor capsid protein [Paenibacillus vini]|uniref:minor capsid protein n=1 Tax=Paenibacillus vini TaxID=1476024 RepID=UPI0025B6D261|nr:minor capsid protein [Paenibacillus vini]MDN4069253.1 minor capsid protein [Paenibacillus vini]MDN4069306.1 minor capsid protein [Paenibacillus vini]